MEEAARGNNLVTSTASPAWNRKTVWFSQMSLEELRKFADWHDGSRAQILAWCHNRWKCGFHYEIEVPASVHF